MRSRTPVRSASGNRLGAHSTEEHDQAYERLCELLVEARKSRGLTQTELGRLLGRDQVTVAKIEAGTRRIDPVEFFAIIRAIGVDWKRFINSLHNLLEPTKKKRSRPRA